MLASGARRAFATRLAARAARRGWGARRTLAALGAGVCVTFGLSHALRDDWAPGLGGGTGGGVEGEVPRLLRAWLSPETPESPESPESPATVRVVVRYGDGARLVRLDEAALAGAAEAVGRALNAELPALQARCRGRLSAEVHAAVAACGGADDGVERFTDWYYAYATAYELLKDGGAAFIHAAVQVEHDGFRIGSAAAKAAVSRKVLAKYEEHALRPDVTEPAVRLALDAATAQARLDFVRTFGRACASALPAAPPDERAGGDAAASSGPGATAAAEPQAELVIDWAACARRASGLRDGCDDDEAASELSAGPVGAQLVGAAVVFKAGAFAFGSAGSTAIQAVASKTLASKMAAPFVAKLVSALGTGATVSTAGLAAGPGAAVAGFAVGCAADWGLAKAVELARREDTEEDVAAAFELTVGEWTDALAEEMDRACEAWTNDAIQLTSRAPVRESSDDGAAAAAAARANAGAGAGGPDSGPA